jgi:hypothetical protein
MVVHKIREGLSRRTGVVEISTHACLTSGSAGEGCLRHTYLQHRCTHLVASHLLTLMLASLILSHCAHRYHEATMPEREGLARKIAA